MIRVGTAANYKHGFGFHPVFCFGDATGETLATKLRPGNAAANNTSDLLEVVDEAVGQLPEKMAAGHRPGDGRRLVNRRIVVRSDSAGGQAFTRGCRDRNLGFQTVARCNVAVSGAVAAANEDPDRWQPAVNQDGTPQQAEDGHPVSEVCEVTDLVDLGDWPADTRLIIRPRLRWQLWHTPARIIRTARREVVRILDAWPTAADILGAYQRIAAFT